MLSSHPRTSTRVEEMQAIMNSNPVRSMRGDGTGKSRFQTNTAALRAANRIYRDYYDTAVQNLKKGNTSEASSLIAKAISADPRQAPFYTLRGLIMLDRKGYAEAERDFAQALRLDTNYQPAYRGLGIVNYSRNNYGQSISYLNRSLSLFPTDLPSHYFIGMSYYRQQQCRQAIQHLKPFGDAQPKHPTVHGVLGQCYENMNDPSSAYTEYVAQTRIDSRSEIGRHAASRAQVLKTSVQRMRIGN